MQNLYVILGTNASGKSELGIIASGVAVTLQARPESCEVIVRSSKSASNA